MKICVYDLSSSYEIRVIDSDTKSEFLTYRMPPALIKDDFFHNNSKCSMFNPATPDFSAFIKMKEGDKFCYSYDNRKLLILTEIIYSLCWEPSSDIAINLAEKYFKAVRNLVNAILNRKTITVGLTILLVPDALPVESQQRLLSWFGRNKSRLLWHSVAVSLGNEEHLKKCEEHAKVAIIDEFSNIGLFTSKIEIKLENGRAVPCHKIYKRADGKISSWYLSRQEENISNALEKVNNDRLLAAYKLHKEREYVDIDKLSGLPVKRNMGLDFQFDPVKIQNAALVISSERSTVYGLNKRENVIKCNIAESGFTGALKFFEYFRDGKIPYYDECESFSVICQNKKEEIEYFELIKANAYLPGGTVTKGVEIGNLCILKGSINAQFKFHLGNVRDNNAQLRQYTQDFPIEKPLEEDRALLLSPSVIPGQGYAEVLIEDNNSDKLFPPIELDWKHMELAFQNGEMVTKAYLEKHLERSFPPDVPPVISKYAVEGVSKHLSVELSAFVKLDLRYDMFFNLSTWPYINDKKKGIERFVRQNVFGSYSEKNGHKYSFPKVRGISEQDYINAFNEIAKIYNVNNSNITKHIGAYFMGDDDQIVRFLAWSYLRYDLEGKLLPQLTKATNKVIKHLEEKEGYSCPASYASYLANMIVIPSEFERVFRVFYRALRYKNGGVSNWCRAMYQILMYTPFIYGKSDVIAKYVVPCMLELVKRLTDEVDNRKWKAVDTILRVMLYLLKRRVIDKDFCKRENPDEVYDTVRHALCYAKTKIGRDKFLQDTIDIIIKYMDGAGTLDGIPAPIVVSD